MTISHMEMVKIVLQKEGISHEELFSWGGWKMSDRVIQIIHLLYDRSNFSDTYITAKDIAISLGLGRKTILMAMLDAKDFLVGKGAYIGVKKSRGYRLEITDNVLFNETFDVLFAQNMISNKTSGDRNERIIDIARKIVSQTKPITIEQISDDLYVSKSTIKNDVKVAYSILADYNIEVRNVNNKGILPIGKEKDFRLCIIDLMGMHYNFFLLKEILDAVYLQWVYCDSNEATQIRRTLLTVLKQYKYQIKDMATQRIAAYLIIMRNRYYAGYLYCGEDKKDVLPQDCIEYTIVNTLFDRLQNTFSNFDVPFIEKQLVAELLYCYQEIDKENFDPEIIRYAQLYCKYIVKKLYYISPGVILSPFFENHMQSLLAHLLLKKRFGLRDSRHFFDTKTDAYIFDSPLSYAIAYDLKVGIEKELGLSFGAADVYSLNLIIYTNIHFFAIPHRKLNVLTHSFDGMDNAQILIDRFDEKFHDFVESNRAVELYEVRELQQHTYDCMILTLPQFSYHELIPPFFTKITALYDDFPRFIDQFIIPTFLYEEYMIHDIRVFDNQKYVDELAVLHQICKDVAEAAKDQAALYEYLYQKYYVNFLTGSDGIVVLFGKFSYINKKCMLLYRYAHSIKWKNHEIKMILFISDDYQSDVTLKLLKIIVNGLIEDNTYRSVLYTTSDPKKLFKEMMEAAIKKSI